MNDIPQHTGAKEPESTDWIELDRRHVWHPYTQMLTAPAPLPIERAEGAYLFTPSGRRIVDAISSWWVTLHGHAHPRIAAAIARQAAELEQTIFAGLTHEPASRLAARIAALLPEDLDRVFFSDNGSTAVEVALKMALQLWSNRGTARRRFLALEGAYHGDTFGAMAVSARSVFTRPFDELLFEVEHLPFPAGSDAVAAMTEAAERAMASGTVAGVIVEPLLLGAGGMRVYAEDALRAIAALCREHAIPLIADEVLTGFGRTGRMFACERAGVVPDIVCLSKGLSGGFLPFALTVCREEIYEAFLSEDRAQTLFHGHSFTANPIGCAAALASLEVFDTEPVFERIEGIERIHRERLSDLSARSGIQEPRIIGTVAAFDLPAERGGYLSDAGRTLAAEALGHDILLRPLGNVIYLLPPYCITHDDLHRIYDFFLDRLAR
jgi:adenosylmethionine-8-amino-7-oxononanoate aminotransferase